MPAQPFSLANLREVSNALYGPIWAVFLAEDLGVKPRTIKGWFNGKPLPDLRQQLAALCRKRGAGQPGMEQLARKIEELGPPE